MAAPLQTPALLVEGVSAACGWVVGFDRLRSCYFLRNENDPVVVDATLEEARVLVATPERWWRTTTTRRDARGAFGCLSCCAVDLQAGAAVGSAGASLQLVEATHAASPALATTC